MIEFEQDNDVAAVLDKPLGFFDHHLGDLDVTHRRLVEGRGDDLSLHRTLHVGDFLRPLIDQQHDQVALGMIGCDRVRDVLHQHGLAGARRGDDQRTLALTDRSHDVDDPRREILPRRIFQLEAETLIGEQRREVVEIDLVLGFLGVFEIEGVDLEESEVALALLGTPDVTFDGITGAQTEAADLRGRDINVVRSWQVIRIRRPEEAEAVGENLDDAFADNVGFLNRKLLEDREHQLLLAHGAGILDPVLFGKRNQFRRRL